MKMQKQNTNQVQDQNQKTVIPKVRYHPSIQTPTPGAKPRPRQAQKTRPAAVRPPQTGTGSKTVQKNQDADKTLQVNPGPAVRSRPDGGQKQGAQKPLQRTASDPDPDRALPRPEQVPLGLGVPLDRRVVEEVEVLTRGQSANQDWFTWRKNRITASVAHRIAHCRFVNGKTRTPPSSYLSDITGEGRRVQTRAMSWGIQMEAQAVCSYQRMKSAALGRPVSVQDCGLFIDARRSWLAASPDGIVTDNRTSQWLLCLEVKCPYKHRDRRVEDACRDDRAFCLELQDKDRREPGTSPSYRLKTSHSYYTQIQVQLAVTGLRLADLVVFTLKETAIVPVTFDPDLWEETVSKLEAFYEGAVLPHLRQKTRQDTAWTPEL
uniref:YqaJ viral recombinase domain-containing protein n=2 Tax=Cyclopterus lumpus TaxID=8103 RepID=A0A8C2X669_CYCLU